MTSMEVAPLSARPWDQKHTTLMGDEATRPFPDVGLEWEFFNESRHWLLLIEPDNTRRVIPPRKIPGNRIVITRINRNRDAVKIDLGEEYSENPLKTNPAYAGYVKDLYLYQEKYIDPFPENVRGSLPNPGQRFNEGGMLLHVGDRFTRELVPEDMGRAVYLAPINCVLVSLNSKPTDTYMRRFNHPYFGRFKDTVGAMEIRPDINALDFEWHCTLPDAVPLWVNVGGIPVEIRLQPGQGLNELIIRNGEGEILRRIAAEDVLAKSTDYNLFLSKNAAVAWKSPIEAAAQKNRYDEQAHTRKFENDELKRMRDAVEAAEKRTAEVEKARREEIEAAKKAADEERKREDDRLKREEERAKREADAKQRKANRFNDALKNVGAAIGALATLVGACYSFYALVTKIRTTPNKK